MPYVIEVTVKSQKGKCALGHKVGDKIVFDGRSVKGDICYSALMTLLPKIYAMRYGGVPVERGRWRGNIQCLPRS